MHLRSRASLQSKHAAWSWGSSPTHVGEYFTEVLWTALEAAPLSPKYQVWGAQLHGEPHFLFFWISGFRPPVTPGPRLPPRSLVGLPKTCYRGCRWESGVWPCPTAPICSGGGFGKESLFLLSWRFWVAPRPLQAPLVQREAWRRPVAAASGRSAGLDPAGISRATPLVSSPNRVALWAGRRPASLLPDKGSSILLFSGKWNNTWELALKAAAAGSFTRRGGFLREEELFWGERTLHVMRWKASPCQHAECGVYEKYRCFITAMCPSGAQPLLRWCAAPVTAQMCRKQPSLLEIKVLLYVLFPLKCTT